MDGEPTFPAGSRRARVVLLVAGAVVLLAAAAGAGVALGAAGRQDHQPDAAAEAVGAGDGATVAGQDPGATVVESGTGGGGGSGGRPASGGGTGGGTGGGGTPRTTTSRPTTTQGPSTTLPPIVVQGTSWSASESCYSGPDGRWHYHVQFHVTVDSIGVGTVRYRWGRGAGDVRSEVKTYDIGVAYAYVTVHVRLTDTISGNADSPTETVIDRLHVLAPPGLNGQPVVATMTHTICP
jgi:hypothetical protein